MFCDFSLVKQIIFLEIILLFYLYSLAASVYQYIFAVFLD
jgi:hypothetical protein